MIRNLIYDVGMHEGEDTSFYLKKGFRVLAVEANPELCTRAKHQFDSEIRQGGLTLVEKAIAPTDGEVEFFVNEKLSVWGTIDRAWAERNEYLGAHSRRVRVPAIRFEKVLAEYDTPYYLKIDIEGADTFCLEAMLELKDRPRYISVETSTMSIKDILYQFRLFAKLGYHKFKIVPQHSVHTQKCPFPALEGVFVEHQFVRGSSGLFGDEAPGNWMNARDAIREYWKVYLSYRMVNNYIGLFRKFPISSVKTYMEHIFWRGVGWYDTHAVHESV